MSSKCLKNKNWYYVPQNMYKRTQKRVEITQKNDLNSFINMISILI